MTINKTIIDISFEHESDVQSIHLCPYLKLFLPIKPVSIWGLIQSSCRFDMELEFKDYYICCTHDKLEVINYHDQSCFFVANVSHYFNNFNLLEALYIIFVNFKPKWDLVPRCKTDLFLDGKQNN